MTNTLKLKKGLGRGLSSLIGDDKPLQQNQIKFLSVLLLGVNFNLEKILIRII